MVILGILLLDVSQGWFDSVLVFLDIDFEVSWIVIVFGYCKYIKEQMNL